jgi:hypothetical protein
MPDILFNRQYTDYETPSSVNAVDSGKIVQTLRSVSCLLVQNILCEYTASYFLRNVGMCTPQQIVPCVTRCHTLIGEPLACVVECMPAATQWLLVGFQVEVGSEQYNISEQLRLDTTYYNLVIRYLISESHQATCLGRFTRPSSGQYKQ